MYHDEIANSNFIILQHKQVNVPFDAFCFTAGKKPIYRLYLHWYAEAHGKILC